MHNGQPCINQPPRNMKKMAKKKTKKQGYTNRRTV